MNKSWGGAREGAGRPSTGRRKVQLYITEDEEKVCREAIKQMRFDNKYESCQNNIQKERRNNRMNKEKETHGAFYQMSPEECTASIDLKNLIDMVTFLKQQSESYELTEMVIIEENNSIAYGFINITRVKTIYPNKDSDDIVCSIRNRLTSVLNDIDLEEEDKIYKVGKLNIFLDYLPR